MKHFGYLRYITALLLFGSCGVLADTIHLSSYEIVFLRTILGFLVITALFFLSRQKINIKKKLCLCFFPAFPWD